MLKFTLAEKLCLQWKDFKENIISSFGSLRGDDDFTDVTLACEDGEQVEAHKMILAASSPVFQSILKRNKHAHPLIYMRGTRSEDLFAILDFLYHGETFVYQENLNSFLVLAEELQFKGHMGKTNERQEVRRQTPELPVKKKESFIEEPRIAPISSSSSVRSDKDSPAERVALENHCNMQKLDEQISSMMTKTGNKNFRGSLLYACNTCGKEDTHSHMRGHIEANHLDGISIPCNFCDKIFRSRYSKADHTQRFHKDHKLSR